MKAVGDKIVLKKLEDSRENRMYGDIIVPLKSDANCKMTRAEVLSVGPLAKDKCVERGDIVLYDTMSVFSNEGEIVITKVENIIFKIEENI